MAESKSVADIREERATAKATKATEKAAKAEAVLAGETIPALAEARDLSLDLDEPEGKEGVEK